jgi:hypothetical protein
VRGDFVFFFSYSIFSSCFYFHFGCVRSQFSGAITTRTASVLSEQSLSHLPNGPTTRYDDAIEFEIFLDVSVVFLRVTLFILVILLNNWYSCFPVFVDRLFTRRSASKCCDCLKTRRLSKRNTTLILTIWNRQIYLKTRFWERLNAIQQQNKTNKLLFTSSSMNDLSET